jgi:signal transduction histidine kinase
MLPLIAFISTTLINLVLGTLVIRRNPKSATHRFFGTLTFAFAIWATVNYISFTASDPTIVLLMVRLVMAFAIVQSVLFMLLLGTFPRSSLSINRKILSIILSVAALAFFVALSPLLVESIELRSNAAPLPQYSFGMALFLPVALGSLISGVIWIIRRNLKAPHSERVQQRYLLIGLIITFALIVSLVLVLPLFYNNTTFIPDAPLFTIPFAIFTAYAIIKHRLMDIRLALARSLSFSFIVGGFLLVYGLIFVFAVPVFSEIVNVQEGIIAAIGALLSIPIARWIRNGLRRLTNRFLFQEQANYRAALVSIGRILSGTINIEEVTDTLLNATSQVLHTRKTIIFLRDQDGQYYKPTAASNSVGLNINIALDHPLINHLQRSPGPVVKDEITIMQENTRQNEHVHQLDSVKRAMEWIDAFVVVPFFVDKELSGFMLLGEKLTGEPYSGEDIEFLSALAPQAATTLENARLYKESLEFGKKLQEEVENATKELKFANSQLKQVDKAKSEFLSIASHQLYTPLTAIRGYLSMLIEGDFGKVTKDQKPIVDILMQSTLRLIELIKNLLDISRIESGRFELKLTSVDLAEMADNMVKNLLPNANAKKLKLTFHKAPKSVPHVAADEGRIRQVVLNFIDNAVKYTDQGTVDVYVKQEGDNVVFSVTDTGKGISEEDIRKLFNKFTRVGGSDKYHTEGTGLGLYVAKQIVAEHHGDLDVQSPGTGKGSTFIMRLPAEGSPKSLKLDPNAEFTIKAAEQHPEDMPAV